MSPKLADEAKVVALARGFRGADGITLRIASKAGQPNVREAARRELLRRSLFGGKG